MKCLKCNNNNFEEKNYRFHPKIKGEEVEVTLPAMACSKCNTPLMNDEQMSNLRKAAANAYRKKYGLLTSEEIINYRKLLGMTQSDFARELKMDENSIKRLETYFVQELSQDKLIRKKLRDYSL